MNPKLTVATRRVNIGELEVFSWTFGLGAFAFELLFGAEPVVELVSRDATARQKDLVGPFADLLVGNEAVGWRC